METFLSFFQNLENLDHFLSIKKPLYIYLGRNQIYKDKTLSPKKPLQGRPPLHNPLSQTSLRGVCKMMSYLLLFTFTLKYQCSVCQIIP